MLTNPDGTVGGIVLPAGERPRLTTLLADAILSMVLDETLYARAKVAAERKSHSFDIDEVGKNYVTHFYKLLSERGR
jgi:hypothetical protein